MAVRADDRDRTRQQRIGKCKIWKYCIPIYSAILIRTRSSSSADAVALFSWPTNNHDSYISPTKKSRERNVPLKPTSSGFILFIKLPNIQDEMPNDMIHPSNDVIQSQSFDGSISIGTIGMEWMYPQWAEESNILGQSAVFLESSWVAHKVVE